MTCIWNIFSHSSFWFRKRETGCSAHWLLAVKLMVPSPLLSPQFSESRLCYLSSSPVGRLSAGFLFHVLHWSQHTPARWYHLWVTGRLAFLSHSILGSPPSHPLSVFCKKKRSLMAFPERVGGVCVWVSPLLECTHGPTFLWAIFPVIMLIAAAPQWCNICVNQEHLNK